MEQAPSSSSSSSASTEAEGAHRGHSSEENRPQLTYRVNISMANPRIAAIRDDAWSCLVILITFWLVATMALIVGIYGSTTLQLGPYSSVLIQVNSMFVQSIQVEQIDEPKPGIMLYGFDEPPALDAYMNWSSSYKGSVPHNFHKEWILYLNQLSELDIFYSVKSPPFSHLSLAMAQDREELFEWIEKPSFPNTTLSWNIIHGRGKISQKIPDSSSYYVALGNLNSQDVEVELNFSVNAIVYNTSNASSRCSPHNSLCRLQLFLSQSTSAVLTTPPAGHGNYEDQWFHLKLSYAPRWITYFIGSGVMTVLIFFLLRFCHVFQRPSFQPQVHVISERAPLLADKNDDALSLGSSYESVTSEEEDLTQWLQGRKPLLKEGELSENNYNSLRHLCVICFDAPRDCFFLPCGHSVACLQCGTRVVEEASTCPICRRKMKKVRKIFTV